MKRKCEVCEATKRERDAVLSERDARASSANLYPIHGWYNFILGYSPLFPRFIFDKYQPSRVFDPFCGSGTTIIEAGLKGIAAVGLDANDFMVRAAQTKLTWNVDKESFQRESEAVLSKIEAEIAKYLWGDTPSIFESRPSYQDWYERPSCIPGRYIEDVYRNAPNAPCFSYGDVGRESLW